MFVSFFFFSRIATKVFWSTQLGMRYNLEAMCLGSVVNRIIQNEARQRSSICLQTVRKLHAAWEMKDNYDSTRNHSYSSEFKPLLIPKSRSSKYIKILRRLQSKIVFSRGDYSNSWEIDFFNLKDSRLPPKIDAENRYKPSNPDQSQYHGTPFRIS